MKRKNKSFESTIKTGLAIRVCMVFHAFSEKKTKALARVLKILKDYEINHKKKRITE